MGTTIPEAPIRVLLVDDDRDDYVLTRSLFAEIPGNPFQLSWVSSYEAGLEAICAGEHDLYLFDYQLGEKTGLDLLAEARCKGCAGAVVLLTGQVVHEIDLAAMQGGAADFLDKSRLDATLLERSLRYALQQKRYEAELERKVKERTEELARANAALREADLRKDEFLATLAHELRNPLAPIRNALEIMRLSADNPQAMLQTRQMMERQVHQLVRLIDDLLDVSRITRGKLNLSLEKLKLQDVLEAALEISKPILDKARLTVSVTGVETPIRVTGDRVRLAQVFTNLLNNAAKYTEPEGHVSIDVRQELTQVVVVVKDNGVGIPAEVLPRIFELFTQVDHNLDRSQGGLGIGLALVRRLVEMHGGTVHAESEGVGRGATFTLRLPL